MKNNKLEKEAGKFKEIPASAVEKDVVIFKSFEVGMNKLISDEAKLSYLLGLRTKHFRNFIYKNKIEEMINKLGFKFKKRQWVKRKQ